MNSPGPSTTSVRAPSSAGAWISISPFFTMKKRNPRSPTSMSARPFSYRVSEGATQRASADRCDSSSFGKAAARRSYGAIHGMAKRAR